MKLTVAIPTFKRPKFLTKCIQSVLDSVGNRPLEILVCDDSIDDTNDDVYETFLFDQRIRVIRNIKNLGIDANICSCVENARGDYVWLIGEDDLMRGPGVAAVMNKIECGRAYPFIYVNYSYINSNQEKELRHLSVSIGSSDIYFAEFSEFLWSAGFIGACVIHRESFLKTQYKDFIGTYYAHVAGITLSSVDKLIGIIPDSLVGNRVGDASTFTWSSDAFGVFQGWRKLLKGLRGRVGDDFYERAYETHADAHGYLGYKFLMTKKADGLLAPSQVELLLSSETSVLERNRILLVSRFFPAVACKILRQIYVAVRQKRLPLFSLN